MSQADNEVFLVKLTKLSSVRSVHHIVVAKDAEEAEEIIKRRFKVSPVFDMSDGLITQVKMIDRSGKEGVVGIDEE